MKLVKNESNGSDLGLIGRGIEVSGEIRFAERLHVDGKVVGKLHSESGTLIVGEAGHLEARIEVGSCIIHGAIHGDIVARSRVEIHRTGKVHGDVITPTLLVEEGAQFNGAIRMGQDAAAPRFGDPQADDDARRKVKGA